MHQSMTLNKTMSTLAEGLRDVIRDTPTDPGEPEDAHTDLATRLVFRLARGGLTIVPAVPSAGYVEAASRIFVILTRWLSADPERSYATSVTPSGLFEVRLITPHETRVFGGKTVQDAYAQAAQTLVLLDGGAP
jgi:hypothetical protein